MSGPHRKNAAEKALDGLARLVGRSTNKSKSWEVRVPEGFSSWAQLEKDAMAIAERLELSAGPRQTLRTLPESVHYHFRREKETGTLELTIWPGESRVWLTVHANRAGRWTDPAADEMAHALARALMRT